MEIWKDIQGYESLYQVSNLGRIKSNARNVSVVVGKGKNKKGTQTVSEKFLRLEKMSNGYVRATMSYNNKQSRKSVHRIVAIAFLPNPHNKPQVNHINGIKSDNRVDNLEWCTGSENERHSIKAFGKLPPLAKRAINIETNEVFTSISKAAVSINILPKTLLAILSGAVKTNKTPIRTL